MSIAANQLQQRRRDQDRVFHETQSFLDQHHNTLLVHDFENRTQQQIEQREVNALAQKLLQQGEEELNDRKNELQSLYNGEMSQWKNNLQSSLEVSQEERMEQIRVRAYALKAKREAERQDYVKECCERQWRDACEDLREYDSKATLDRIVKDREMMIETKRISEERQRPLQNEAAAISLINKDESAEQSQRRQSNLVFKSALDHQVQWKRSQLESTTRQTQLDDQEELRQLRLLDQRTAHSDKELIEKAREGGDEMLRATWLRAEERDAKKHESRRQNAILLQHALGWEQRQIQMEQRAREGGKEAANEYAQCVQEQAVVEEAEKENINRIRNAELERLAKLSDGKLMAEAEFKRQWMEDVDTSRQEQIRQKRIEEESIRTEMDQYAVQAQAALLQADVADKKEAEKAQAVRMETMLENKAVLLSRGKEREKEQQKKYLIQKQIQNDQRVYRRRLEKQKNRCGVSDLV